MSGPGNRPRSSAGKSGHTVLYRAVARALALLALRGPDIEAVCVRRSVASGDARFPFSDLDFDLTVRDGRGVTLARVARRVRVARALFPRTGHVFALSADEIPVVAALEPYRASINRRCGWAARGDLPEWPEVPIAPMELGRRVVFWLDEFFPDAVRAGRRRHQRKFRLEMLNALGVLEGRWSSPRVSLREVAAAFGDDEGGSPFAAGLAAAGRAAELLGVAAPRVADVLELPGLAIVPSAETPWPASARGVVATPEALALLLATQRPTLWIEHGAALAALGFAAPARASWIGMAARLASPLWIRGPVFFERLSPAPVARLELAERIVEGLERGELPERTAKQAASPASSAADYYSLSYDRLAERALAARERLERLDAA